MFLVIRLKGALGYLRGYALDDKYVTLRPVGPALLG